MLLALDCETIHAGFMGQVVNASSSLTFVIVGWLVLKRGKRIPGTALMAVGLGSFLFHGPMPSWAGLIHDLTLYWLVAVIVLLVFTSTRHRGELGPMLVLAAAGVAWGLGGSDSPACRPDSILQFHAVWHVGAAVALGWWVLIRRAWSRSEASH